jgi:glycerol-3-phosphate dehydrogenase
MEDSIVEDNLMRGQLLARLPAKIHDVVIIGGGINGAVSAAALSAKGASVALIEARDFSGFSSQESSTLAWGGIKYMENYEFGLVGELCKSRNRLMKSFPSSVREIRFTTNLERGFRHSRAKLYAGTLLYWILGRCRTRTPDFLSKRAIKARATVINTANSVGGFEYSDAHFVDGDSRFTFQFIRSVIENNSIAVNYTKATRAVRGNDGLWLIEAKDLKSGTVYKVKSRSIVNACGAFADGLNRSVSVKTKHKHLFSKGVHLIVRRLAKSNCVLTFFADDGRLFFALPMGDKTCIGTTDEFVENPLTTVTDEDRDFILRNINSRLDLDAPLTRDDIISERCGVRPLAVNSSLVRVEDAFSVSRRHIVELDAEKAFVTVFGGKLTGCLNTGEEVCKALEAAGIRLPTRKAKWFGESDASVRADFLGRAASVAQLLGFSKDRTLEYMNRLWRYYDVDAHKIVDELQRNENSRELIVSGKDFTKAELEYCKQRELVICTEDFLRRRTNIALTDPAVTISLN